MNDHTHAHTHCQFLCLSSHTLHWKDMNELLDWRNSKIQSLHLSSTKREEGKFRVAGNWWTIFNLVVHLNNDNNEHSILFWTGNKWDMSPFSHQEPWEKSKLPD